MTKEEFKQHILSEAGKLRKKYPEYRKGQAVFNYIGENYGNVARICQFACHIDCFYIDENINQFIDTCYELIHEKKSNNS